MRLQSLTLAAAGAALLAPTAVPAQSAVARHHEREVAEREVAPDVMRQRPGPVEARGEPPVTRSGRGRAPDEGRVRAAELLARTRHCDRVSHGRYRSDAGAPATVPVCGTRDAVFWKADMDIDCDGRPTARCNRRTDPHFVAGTAVQRSDGGRLDAEHLPYVVVPAPGATWDHRDQDVHGGSVAALVYRDRVRYAVVGDVGPRNIIGEASYAAARALGIHADPGSGGVPSGVTYIVFRDSRVSPVEDPAAATTQGERLARHFARGD